MVCVERGGIAVYMLVGGTLCLMPVLHLKRRMEGALLCIDFDLTDTTIYVCASITAQWDLVINHMDLAVLFVVQISNIYFVI